MPRDFVIRHLPKRVTFLEFHFIMPRMVSRFCIFPIKLNSLFCFSLYENNVGSKDSKRFFGPLKVKRFVPVVTKALLAR